MFGFFKKDPIKKLQKKHEVLMKEAMQIQRTGNLRLYADKIAEAEEVQKEIENLYKK